MDNNINAGSSGKIDTHSYRGWLNSDSFWKRAFGVWGHMIAAQLVTTAIVFAVMLVLGLVFGFGLSSVSR